MVKTVLSMSKITTKRGDSGSTNLFGALRVPKYHFLVQIIGSLDELQATIGLFKVKVKKTKILAELTYLQKSLYRLMAFLANPKTLKLTEANSLLEWIENKQEAWEKLSQIGNQFVVPGQNEAEAWAHFCRVKTRSTERLMNQLAEQSPKITLLLPIINRLSDYFFVISQYLTTP